MGVTISIRAALTFLLHKEQKTQKRQEDKEEQTNKQTATARAKESGSMIILFKSS